MNTMQRLDPQDIQSIADAVAQRLSKLLGPVTTVTTESDNKVISLQRQMEIRRQAQIDMRNKQGGIR